jgi:hypothetical protein
MNSRDLTPLGRININVMLAISITGSSEMIEVWINYISRLFGFDYSYY